jgi:hypothetical protein
MKITVFNTTPTDAIIGVLTELLPDAKEINIKAINIIPKASGDVKVELIIFIDGKKYRFSNITDQLSEFDKEQSEDTVLIALEIFKEEIGAV